MIKNNNFLSQPLVSVIVPTYNGAKRIARTLQSIIEQDYENLEIIVVDDVSTDNTVEVVQKVLEDSGRNFQLIKRSVNGHQSAARNTGFKASRGKYVIFFDHDDLAEKNFVSRLCREIEDRRVDFAFCGFKYYFEHEDRYEPNPAIVQQLRPSPQEYLRAWGRGEIVLGNVWNYIFNRNFIVQHNLRFPEDCYTFEDYEFVIKAFAVSSRVFSMSDNLYIHVIHPAQQTQADSVNRINYKTIEQEVMANWRAARRILKHINDSEIRNYALSHCIAHTLIRQLTFTARAGDREYYDLKVKHVRHKRIREIFWRTVKFIFKEPELFFKALMVMYLPGFYYRLRAKR